MHGERGDERRCLLVHDGEGVGERLPKIAQLEGAQDAKGAKDPERAQHGGVHRLAIVLDRDEHLGQVVLGSTSGSERLALAVASGLGL